MAYYKTTKVFISKGSDRGARPCISCAVLRLCPSLPRPKPWSFAGVRRPKLRRALATTGDRVNSAKLNGRRSRRNLHDCPGNRVVRQDQITCSRRLRDLIYIEVIGSSHRHTRVSSVYVTVERNQRQHRPYDPVRSLIQRLTAEALVAGSCPGDRNL